MACNPSMIGQKNCDAVERWWREKAKYSYDAVLKALPSGTEDGRRQGGRKIPTYL